MEYEQLVTAYLSVVNMYWLGYGVFFTINALLAAGLGFLYSVDVTEVHWILLTTARLLLPAIGVFISCSAISATEMIGEAQGAVAKRGAELDGTLHTEMFLRLNERVPPEVSKSTIAGSWLFAGFWYFAASAAGWMAYVEAT